MSDDRAEVEQINPSDRLEWLIELAFALTVAARDEYHDASKNPAAAVNALGCYNELAHQLTGQVAKIVCGDEDVYPHATLLRSLHETAQRANRDEQLRRAMDRATRLIRKK